MTNPFTPTTATTVEIQQALRWALDALGRRMCDLDRDRKLSRRIVNQMIKEPQGHANALQEVLKSVNAAAAPADRGSEP